MAIESAAHNIENEAVKNPTEAASSIRLLGEVQQTRIINQMQKDATQQDVSFSVQRDRNGNVSALNFTPMFGESGTAGAADKSIRKW